MISFRKTLLIAAGLLGATGLNAADLGNLVFIGDSITHGGATTTGGNYTPSYRYDVWKYLVDDAASYNFVGSITGAYSNRSVSATTPSYRGQTFANIHEGHWGWRASWESGAIALPSGRENTGNLGSGTLSNWLGLTSAYTNSAGAQTYTGTTYKPDTAVIMLGVNDIGSSSGGTLRTAAQVLTDLNTMVSQLQQKNANVRVYVSAILPSANSTVGQVEVIAQVNAGLASGAIGWSTGTSSVSYVPVPANFNPTADTNANNTTGGMTGDNTHPNLLGERVIADNFAQAMGLGPRTNGLSRRDGGAFVTQVNSMGALPGTTAGTTLYRSGNTGAWTAGTGGLTLNAVASAATLNSTWSLTSNQAYTVEARLKMGVNGLASNYFVIWSDDGAAGANAGFLRIYEGKTAWGFTGAGDATYSSILDFNPNTDALHTFRVAFNGTTYQVWRDGALIGENLTGSSNTSATNAVILGNFSGANTVTATLAAVSLDTTGAYAPTTFTVAAVPEPSTYGLIGAGALAAAALVRRRRKATVVAA